MRKWIDKVFVAVCAVLVLGMGTGLLSGRSGGFSEVENRMLAGAPRLSWRSVMSGDYFDALSAFCADNIPFRTALIRTKAVSELVLGKQQNNGVMFLADGTLVDRCEYESHDMLSRNLDQIEEFSAKYNAHCIFVPRSVDIYLPNAEASRQTLDAVYRSGLCSEALQIELTQANGDGESVYYKTDHHLTTHGAYILYTVLAAELGVTPYPESYFHIQEVSNDFIGSIYSRSGLLAPTADCINLYRYSGDGDYQVTCHDSNCSLSTLYSTEKLSEKDKYQVFLSGNHGILTVTSPVDKPDLLLFKDSFANAVIPFLALHFDLTVIDPRYMTEAPSCDNYSQVAVIVGIDTLATGGNFLWEKVSPQAPLKEP